MTSRRKTKRLGPHLWNPFLMQRGDRRIQRCYAKGTSAHVYWTWCNPEPLDWRFDHSRVLRRKARCGRKRR